MTQSLKIFIGQGEYTSCINLGTPLNPPTLGDARISVPPKLRGLGGKNSIRTRSLIFHKSRSKLVLA
jgi:hypothetical protein